MGWKNWCRVVIVTVGGWSGTVFATDLTCFDGSPGPSYSARLTDEGEQFRVVVWVSRDSDTRSKLASFLADRTFVEISIDGRPARQFQYRDEADAGRIFYVTNVAGEEWWSGGLENAGREGAAGMICTGEQF